MDDANTRHLGEIALSDPPPDAPDARPLAAPPLLQRLGSARRPARPASADLSGTFGGITLADTLALLSQSAVIRCARARAPLSSGRGRWSGDEGGVGPHHRRIPSLVMSWHSLEVRHDILSTPYSVDMLLFSRTSIRIHIRIEFVSLLVFVFVLVLVFAFAFVVVLVFAFVAVFEFVFVFVFAFALEFVVVFEFVFVVVSCLCSFNFASTRLQRDLESFFDVHTAYAFTLVPEHARSTTPQLKRPAGACSAGVKTPHQ